MKEKRKRKTKQKNKTYHSCVARTGASILCRGERREILMHKSCHRGDNSKAEDAGVMAGGCVEA